MQETTEKRYSQQMTKGGKCKRSNTSQSNTFLLNMETSLPSASDVKIGNTVESKVSSARLSTDTEHRRRCNTRDELKEARRRINAF